MSAGARDKLIRHVPCVPTFGELVPRFGILPTCGKKSGVLINLGILWDIAYFGDKSGKICGHTFPSDVKIRL